MDLSIIIINYKTKQLTFDCVMSILNSDTGFSYEIILVDNASEDGIIEEARKMFPNIKCIQNNSNYGFAKANNIGILQSTGKYVLLLNSDTILESRTLDIMVGFMEENLGVGVSGCKIVLPDGTLDKACRRGFPTPWASFTYIFGLSRVFPSTPIFNQYQLSHLDPDEEYLVDSLVGAFMLVRRESISQVGMLDEDFFMYGEDIDWCYRIREAGWRNYYFPKTQIIHYKGASSRTKPFKIVYEFHRAMFLFHRKHYQKKYNFFINGLVYVGIGVKFVATVIKNKLLEMR